MKRENVVTKKSYHCRGMGGPQGSSVSRIRLRKQAGCFCLITTFQKEDSRQKHSGMTPYFTPARGFTLIELLVVVLIIGILAAVALPQYQLAVDKSRFSAAKPYVKALDEAQQIYYLANGEYSADWNLLDIGFPQGISVDQYNRPRFGQLLLHTNKTYSVGYLLDNNENRYVSYTIYRTKNPMGGVSLYGKSTCLSYGTDNLTRGDKICKAFNGQFITQSTTCGTTIDGEPLKCNIYLLE